MKTINLFAVKDEYERHMIQKHSGKVLLYKHVAFRKIRLNEKSTMEDLDRLG